LSTQTSGSTFAGYGVKKAKCNHSIHRLSNYIDSKAFVSNPLNSLRAGWSLLAQCYLMLKIYLKVPSGQIRSVWEWYHWIHLDKDINRYGFLIFNVDLESLKRLHGYEPVYTKMPPAFSTHGLYRILWLSSYWLANYYFMKKSA
jgi:hypothetical protein